MRRRSALRPLSSVLRPLASAILLALPAFAFAQGALTPPGAPAETMKTLDQIEPRIPIKTGVSGVFLDQNGGYIISASGSYYLDGNITVASGNALTITAPDVTIDLNGFLLLSTAGTGVVRGSGVEFASGVDNGTIRNGHIRGGFDSGISSYGVCVVAEDVGITDCLQYGIHFPGGGEVRRCAVSGASAIGIDTFNAGEVIDSRAENCSAVGIYCRVARNCYAKTTTDMGIRAWTAINCTAFSSSGIGLDVGIAIGCNGISVSNIGLQAEESATGCTGATNTGDYAILVRPPYLSGLFPGSAENCFARVVESTNKSSIALYAGTATNCTGSNTTGTGLVAEVATGCRGTSRTGTGLRATQTATGCLGITTSGINGLLVGNAGVAGGTAENCRGIVDGGTGTGLSADTATNCFGQSTAGTGLYANTASNCSANTASGTYAMDVAGSATNCRGNNGSGGTAIRAAIAVSCTTAAGPIVAPNKYNMP